MISIISAALAIVAFIVGLLAVASGAVSAEQRMKNEPPIGANIVALGMMLLSVALAFLAGVLA
jgi:hypothetical protein